MDGLRVSTGCGAACQQVTTSACCMIQPTTVHRCKLQHASDPSKPFTTFSAACVYNTRDLQVAAVLLWGIAGCTTHCSTFTSCYHQPVKAATAVRFTNVFFLNFTPYKRRKDALKPLGDQLGLVLPGSEPVGTLAVCVAWHPAQSPRTPDAGCLPCSCVPNAVSGLHGSMHRVIARDPWQQVVVVAWLRRASSHTTRDGPPCNCPPAGCGWRRLHSQP